MNKLLLLFILFLFCSYTKAEPYLPKSDLEVLEKLTINIGTSNELKKLKQSLKRNPNDIKLVISTARRFIEIGREESDPRYFGYAKSLIKPFLNKKNPEILVLSSIIKQYNHDFEGALLDLDEALKLDPENTQAWVTRSSINTTLGRYDEAKKDCIPVLRAGNEISTIFCVSYPASLSGSANKSYTALKDIYSRAANVSKEEKVSILSLIAEIAFRLGKVGEAEIYFKEALKIKSKDSYLLTSYSDFLLSQGRYSEVINLLKDRIIVDGLFLRFIIAEKNLKLKEVAIHTQELKDRFDAEHKRGDSIHLREESLFNLEILNDLEKALDLARKNWDVQKEPIDSKILLKVAVIKKDKVNIKNVINFIKENKTEGFLTKS